MAHLPDQPVYTTLCQAQTKDLVEYGMIPEFIGRFATVTVLHELSQEDLKQIIHGSVTNSPLERQQRLALLHGIRLELTEGALDAIAEEAALLGTGARGLTRLIGRAVDPVDHRWPELASQGICRVVIHRKCLTEGAEPELITGPVTERLDSELRAEALSLLPQRPRPVLPRAGGQTAAPEITDTRNWSDEDLWNALEKLKQASLGWDQATGSARKWWETFEQENRHRPALIYRLTEELRNRKATIVEFFLAFVYSNTDNIQANLHYLDYMRLKKPEGSAA